MSRGTVDIKTIHLSDLDEFLAFELLEQPLPIALAISKKDSQGNITILSGKNNSVIDEKGIDFELSPSEYQSLDSVNISDFTNQTVYTSSAYEFFDFILMYCSELQCIADFYGNSWRIRIINFAE